MQTDSIVVPKEVNCLIKLYLRLYKLHLAVYLGRFELQSCRYLWWSYKWLTFELAV